MRAPTLNKVAKIKDFWDIPSSIRWQLDLDESDWDGKSLNYKKLTLIQGVIGVEAFVSKDGKEGRDDISNCDFWLQEMAAQDLEKIAKMLDIKWKWA